MTTIRALIVDDEPRIRRGIERIVRSCGDEWEVVAVAADGREALAALREHRGVDLLITDVKMPEMDGLALIREAKKEFTFVPLLISGFDDFEYLQTALREGAADYILKPIDREQLRQRLEEVKAKIVGSRLDRLKRGELEQQAERLKQTRRIQWLSYITSAGLDVSRLGYWVDEFPEGKFRLLYVSIDTPPVKTRAYTAKDWEAFLYAMENMIEELTSGKRDGTGGGGWCWRGGDSDFWALLHACDDEGVEPTEEAAQDVADRIRSAIQKYTPFTVSVSVSDLIEDLYLLPDARRRTLSLMNARLLFGGNRTFLPSFEEASASREAERAEPELQRLAERIRQAAVRGDAAECARLCRAFFQEASDLDAPHRIQRAAQRLILQLHAAGLEHAGPERYDAASLEEALQAARSAPDLHRLRETAANLARRVAEDAAAAREGGGAKPIEQAKRWIEEHLAGDITIKKIADHVYMNPTYFCQYFKTQTGDTVLDYVTKLRMERAKALLRDPALKLQDVSERVGYHDAKYFSRLFKEWTGSTPSKYREQALHPHA
ncbi:response regulator [Paenibacillus sp.]|uniref:response regulator n=1 Tax=Paenibacillus sp. TaxID=58172 RepID=UPI002D3461C1|nr:response regulator [Paenibacillus sp.]HZG85438.1 response regulator [Paenibacillus sp.]